MGVCLSCIFSVEADIPLDHCYKRGEYEHVLQDPNGSFSGCDDPEVSLSLLVLRLLFHLFDLIEHSDYEGVIVHRNANGLHIIVLL